MMDPADIQTLEERALNAWPALRTIVIGGWLARLSNGYTKRANSLNALGGCASSEGVIEAAEALYARHGLPAIFRLSPLAPAPFDTTLAAAGYDAFDPSLVLIAPLGMAEPASSVRIDGSPSIEWLDGFAQANAVATVHRAVHDAIIGAIALPAAFATIRRDGESVGFGLAIFERHAIGLFDIVVIPGARGRGYGRALVAALMAWGRKAGARQAYLQVREQNDAARRLYAGLGFAEAYRYHYRVPKTDAR